MGVTYKLREEVVHFIISQRQSNPLASCRLLAESTSQKFGLHLSKSSVHDVLKESGITSPRGRKPKYKFEIPKEKKEQIQADLSQVELIPDSIEIQQESVIASEAKQSFKEISSSAIANPKGEAIPEKTINSVDKIYEQAGKIFLKAAFWDLGVFSEENIKATDWKYYLTYSKGIRVDLKNDKSFFIDLPLPLERCIREATDGLINNVRPFIVHKVSDEGAFKASMNAQAGFKINSISIVDYLDHVLFKLDNIMELNRVFLVKDRIFVESDKINTMERSRALFFSQIIDNDEVIDNILDIKGFCTTNKDENTVTLLIQDGHENKAILHEAAEKLNGMYLSDEQGRLVSVKIQLP